MLDRAQTQDKASSLPLLNALCGDLLHQEMAFFVDNVAARAHRKHDLLIFARPEQRASRDDLRAGQGEGEEDSRSGGGAKPPGLFRGKSLLDHPLERVHAAVTRCVLEGGYGSG